MQVLAVLLFIAGIFLLGFFGNLFFRKTKISDIFFLIIIGYLLGPLFNIIPVDKMDLSSVTPILGALALIILLFEGGLHLNFYKVIKELGNATKFTILVFLITVLLCSGVLYFIFSYPFIYGLLIGSIIGGVSSAVTIPLIRTANSNESTKTLLTLESAMTDALCVIITIAIVQVIISQNTSIQFMLQGIFSAFAIATVIGVLGGIFWLKVLRDWRSTHEYSYLLTLSFLFILYVLSEYVKGNGAFCALIFGLVLGNSPEILKIFKMKEFKLNNTIKQFQSEISLFIKTFFFIYLGLIVDLSLLDLKLILIVIFILIVSIASRILSAKLLFSKDGDLNKYEPLIVSLHARGLAAAVLATYPLTMGIVNDYTLSILPIAFLIIILTNLTTTISYFMFEKKQKDLNSKKEQEIKVNIN
jgi:cell volume regulation protein A